MTTMDELLDAHRSTAVQKIIGETMTAMIHFVFHFNEWRNEVETIAYQQSQPPEMIVIENHQNY